MDAVRAAKAFLFLLSALAASMFAIGTYAVFAQSGTTGPVPTGAGTYGPTLGTNIGHVYFGGGPAPSINAACGTGSVAPIGSDSAYSFQSGTSSTSSCVATFATPWKVRPTCSLDTQSAITFNVTATQINFTGITDSLVVDVICIGKPGG